MTAAAPLLATAVHAGGTGGAVLSVHIVMAAALAAAMRSGRRWGRVALSWLPLAAIPLLYAELPWLIATVGASFGDPVVRQWEVAVFGGQPARVLAAAVPVAWLSELLHLSYLSYYAIIYVPMAVLFARARGTVGDARRSGAPRTAGGGAESGEAGHAFGEASLAVMATFILCFAAFVFFPVQGPRFLWPSPEGIPEGPVRSLVLAILERGSSRGAAFPSSHMAVAVVQALSAFRWRIPGRALIAVATAGIGVGAVYGGFHYAIDMVAGALLGGLVFLLVRRWGERVTGAPAHPTR